ncbi:MAG: DUF1800 family protein [Spirochaetota bacterium]
MKLFLQIIYICLLSLFLSQCRMLNLIDCQKLTSCTDYSDIQLLSLWIGANIVNTPDGIFVPAVSASGASDDADLYNSVAVSDAIWDETQVRKVLHAFAYGGPASDSQITTWANMRPGAAIVQMLTMQTKNQYLAQALEGGNTPVSETGASLSGLTNFFADGNMNDNPTNYAQSNRYGNGLGNSWSHAIKMRGLNPFRQKIGMLETNYHLATNLDKNVNPKQMVRYYDEILNDIASGTNYYEVLANAALSAAIATQYNHRRNIIENATFRGNEDFAREFHQLFFGILGTGVNGNCGVLETDTCDGNPENFYYHELRTIRQTAEALTDIQVEGGGDFLPDVPTFGTTQHASGNLTVYNQAYSGTTASERIQAFAPQSIQHAESLQSLPVIIVRFLADENLDPDNPISGTASDINTKLSTIRSLWAGSTVSNSGQINLIEFLRKYAVSDAFHNATRVKYRTTIDRIMTIANLTTLGNGELDINLIDSFSKMGSENVIPFRPEHDVFGGQTGLEAADTDDVFKSQYNSVRSNRFGTASVWNGSANVPVKNFVNITKDSADLAAATTDISVKTMAEFLWKRYTADNSLQYLGTIERAHIYSLLATGTDFMFQTNSECRENTFRCSDSSINSLIIYESDITGQYNDLYRQFESDVLFKTGESAELNSADNDRIGYAIDFIASTPFLFVQEGINQ